jgi:hypothetical protein
MFVQSCKASRIILIHSPYSASDFIPILYTSQLVLVTGPHDYGMSNVGLVFASSLATKGLSLHLLSAQTDDTWQAQVTRLLYIRRIDSH